MERSPTEVAGTSPSTARRWTLRGLAVTAVAVPLVLAMSGTAGAAELTPIAEYLDETIAATSKALIVALSALLGVWVEPARRLVAPVGVRDRSPEGVPTLPACRHPPSTTA